jgi:hypothetical protein
MGESAVSAAGYHVIWGTSYIGEVIEPRIPKETRNMVINTTHDALAANGGVETKSIGTITQDDGSIKIYYLGSTVHASLKTDFKAGTERTVWFIRPQSGALIGTSVKCTAVISSLDEPIDKNDNVTWEMSITPTGALTEVSSVSANLTTPFFVVSDDDTPTPNVIIPVPAATAAVHAYNVELYSDNTTFTITPTASTGTIYVNGVLVVSGAASGAITVPAAGKKLYIPIVVMEANKTPNPYLLCMYPGSTTHP